MNPQLDVLSEVSEEFIKEQVDVKPATKEESNEKEQVRESIHNFLRENKVYAKSLQSFHEAAFKGAVKESMGLFIECASIAFEFGYPCSNYSELIKRARVEWGLFKEIDDRVMSLGGYSKVYYEQHERLKSRLSRFYSANIQSIRAFINGILSGSIIYSSEVKENAITEEEVRESLEEDTEEA